MRRQKTQSLSDVIRSFKSQYRLENDLDKLHARKAWVEAVGPNAARHTTKLYFRGNILYAHISSSVLRYELNAQRKTLKNRINESLGREIVGDVILK